MTKCLPILLLSAAAVFGQQSGDAPDRQSGVNSRGDHAMGFSHEKTTHHFRLYSDGGAIEVDANKAEDKESRDQIRMHLRHISQMFAEGNFQVPMLVHDEVPPGVPVMKRLAAQIKYEFQPTDGGGRVRITVKDPEALAAVHTFLRYQIKDHQTGDATEATPHR